MAPSTPPPPSKLEFAALTIASMSMVVISVQIVFIISKITFSVIFLSYAEKSIH
jgi:hypothetical protein